MYCKRLGGQKVVRSCICLSSLRKGDGKLRMTLAAGSTANYDMNICLWGIWMGVEVILELTSNW